MTDERFEHDLKSVLREIAGEEAPMSLRNRVADLIDQAPLGRRLWFTPPMKLSLAAVGAAAVVVLAVLFVGPRLVGPTPSQTAEPSTSASTTATAEPTATLEPTAVPTPRIAAWTGLDWTAGSTDQGSWWNINDIVPWGDGYVGVGSSLKRSAGNGIPTSPASPAFFTSADGLHWTIAQEDGPDSQLPARLVRVGDTLLAVGHNPDPSGAPKLWRTEDGSTWSPLDSPTWRQALANNTLISVAAGPTGIVAVGAEGTMAGQNPQGPPVITFSSDGLTWHRLDLSSVFDNAYFKDVAPYPGGFVIVGRVGERDDWDNGASANPRGAGVGVPAAWTSSDGVTWSAAQVDGSAAAGATLSNVIVGADGLFASGQLLNTSLDSHPSTSGSPGQPGDPISGWASTDGRSWHLVGKMGTDLPLATSFVGDGAHMVMFGRESCKTTELSAWTSLDGVTWTHLAFSGTTWGYLTLIPGPICNDDGTEGWNVGTPVVTYAAVMPDGVVVVTSSSAPAPPTYWFLTATTQ